MVAIREKEFLRPMDVCAMFAITRTTLTRWRNNGSFPPAVKLGPATVGWRREAMERWMDERSCEK